MVRFRLTRGAIVALAMTVAGSTATAQDASKQTVPVENAQDDAELTVPVENAQDAAKPTEPVENLPDASKLTVLVENVQGADGKIRVALWNAAEGFTESEAVIAHGFADASLGEKTVIFEGLAPGTYALAAYHDENDNGKFDRTFIGLPAEGLGFSNGAWIKAFGPPSFEEAAIEVENGGSQTTIALRY